MLLDIKKLSVTLILISGIISSLFGTLSVGPASIHFFIVLVNLIACTLFLLYVKKINLYYFVLPIFFYILLNFTFISGLFGFLENVYILSTFLFFLLGFSLSYNKNDKIFFKKIINFTICVLALFCFLFLIGLTTDIDTRWSSIFIAIMALSGLVISKGNFKILVLSIFLLLFVLISGSRGVLFSLMISYLITHIFFKFKLRYSIPVILIILTIFYVLFEKLLGLIFAIDIIRERTFYDGIYDYNKIINFEFDSSGRDIAWPLYWAEINNRIDSFLILIGSGPGSISDFGVYHIGSSWEHPHNEIIRVLYDYGLIGLLCFLIFWIFVIQKILKAKEIYLKKISVVLILFMFLIMLTDNPLMYPVYFGNFFMFIVGMTCSSLSLNKEI